MNYSINVHWLLVGGQEALVVDVWADGIVELFDNVFGYDGAAASGVAQAYHVKTSALGPVQRLKVVGMVGWRSPCGVTKLVD